MHFVAGESDTRKLKSGISEQSTTVQTRNLGELFNEAKKKSFAKAKNSKNTKRKIFNTGVLYLHVVCNKNYVQGFQWRYLYKDKKGKNRTIARVDLLKLKEEVINRGFEWKVINKRRLYETAKKANVPYNQLL